VPAIAFHRAPPVLAMVIALLEQSCGFDFKVAVLFRLSMAIPFQRDAAFLSGEEMI
jgi:hypothetical protein